MPGHIPFDSDIPISTPFVEVSKPAVSVIRATIEPMRRSNEEFREMFAHNSANEAALACIALNLDRIEELHLSKPKLVEIFLLLSPKIADTEAARINMGEAANDFNSEDYKTSTIWGMGQDLFLVAQRAAQNGYQPKLSASNFLYDLATFITDELTADQAAMPTREDVLAAAQNRSLRSPAEILREAARKLLNPPSTPGMAGTPPAPPLP